jgi:hypothetical protein
VVTLGPRSQPANECCPKSEPRKAKAHEVARTQNEVENTVPAF